MHKSLLCDLRVGGIFCEGLMTLKLELKIYTVSYSKFQTNTAHNLIVGDNEQKKFTYESCGQFFLSNTEKKILSLLKN